MSLFLQTANANEVVHTSDASWACVIENNKEEMRMRNFIVQVMMMVKLSQAIAGKKYECCMLFVCFFACLC